MKDSNPIHKATNLAAEGSILLSEKTLKKAEEAKTFFTRTGNMTIFILQTIRHSFSFPFEFREFIKQCYEIGNRSLPLVAITGAIMGLVLTIQSRPILNDFGAESMLPQMVAISLIREIGPVITALICAGKIGSGIGAELGSMKVTEQIDAMEVSATNPMKYLVVTRVIAATMMLPILVMFADFMGMLGSWAGVNIKDDLNIVLFFSRAFSVVDFMDFIPAFIKSFLFGAVIGLVGCYKGYNAGRGTESVGIAANSAVVLSSLLIIVVDLIVVQITDILL
ncbi:MAG: transporter permease [Bacteroidetes bacterium]|jgi:phospholipid/cholesterol/gamma-HCH transport system permease protein|nr:transporter permease [Bacteroidota bacterium]